MAAAHAEPPAESAAAAVPGVVIYHTPAALKRYVGSPAIVNAPDGAYLAACDLFGPGTTMNEKGQGLVFRSDDRGATWKNIARIDGMFWTGLFMHRGATYLMGVDRQYGHVVIRRSDDGGRTWTKPTDAEHGLLTSDAGYHTSTMPIIEHNGRLWRGMEDNHGPGGKWGLFFRAGMLSAPADADLLKASSWTLATPLPRDVTWLNGDFGGWLEGNAVVAPGGGVVDVLRVEYPSGNKAAIVTISPDGKTASFDPASGFVDLPGGATKFNIRFDPTSKLYWALSNPAPQEATKGAAGYRNTLALISSPDLRTWTIRCTLIHHPDRTRHGVQYADWQFEGEDIIAAIRTAWDDDAGGAHNFHDANYLTFLRIVDFRNAK
ncbi:MAG: exo-alpha-sialidase [Planctomycetes bacterium]|nr:exo-alpha-sialidase [Planctomycetota bacterium]